MDRLGDIKELNWISDILLDKFREKNKNIWLSVTIKNGFINPYSIDIISQNKVKRNPEKIIQFSKIKNLKQNKSSNYYIYIRNIKF